MEKTSKENTKEKIEEKGIDWGNVISWILFVAFIIIVIYFIANKPCNCQASCEQVQILWQKCLMGG